MDMREPIGAPGRVAALKAEPAGRGCVQLRWLPPPDQEHVEHTRFFVVCLRIDAGRRERLVATRFLPGDQRTHAEVGLPPGAYRFEVGALGPTGSGPRERVVVRVDVNGAVRVLAHPDAAGR